MIAADLLNQIDALESMLADKDVEVGTSARVGGKLLVIRDDLKVVLKLSKRMLDGHERPMHMSLHDMEISCAAGRVKRERDGETCT